MPTPSDSRRALARPTWHFWVLALAVLPVSSVALIIGGSAGGATPALMATVAVVVSAALLAQERAVRGMESRWRAAWTVGGCLAAAAVAAALFVALVVLAVTVYCESGCG